VAAGEPLYTGDLRRLVNYPFLSFFTDAQLKAVLWSFVQIKKLAGERNVTIVIIPPRAPTLPASRRKASTGSATS
jgi:hypothetical protein